MSGDGRTSTLHAPATLEDYLGILRRRLWLVLPTVIIAPLVALALASREPALYNASADVLIGRQNLALTLNGVDDPTLENPERLAQTQAYLARVPQVAAKAIDAVGLRDRSAQDLLAASKVSTKPNADVLVFEVSDHDPELARRLATEYARQFTIYRRQLDTAELRQSVADVEDRLARLEAAGEGRSALYVTLLEKAERLKSMEALQSSSTTLVRPAEGADQIRPRPMRSALLALGLGLLLGIGIAFVREALDTRARSVEEIEERLGLPLLARLPRPPAHLRAGDRLVTVDEPDSEGAEAYRTLRANLDFVKREVDAKAIMVTSAVESEGKSQTIANLAVTFARAGRHVVLVDLDLRHPFLHRLFALRSRPGLVDVATGSATIDEALVRIPVADTNAERIAVRRPSTNGSGPAGKLEVLAAGEISPNPGELVGTRAVRAVLDNLRRRADLVLIDAPPILRVGDAIALSAHVDGIFVVTRASVARRGTLKELRRALERCAAVKLGFAPTGVDPVRGYGLPYSSFRLVERDEPEQAPQTLRAVDE